VREDVLDGFTTLEQAREAYGVVIDDALEVDLAATTALRERLAAEARPAELV
jgi:N-methylhydantoinase B